ncbi:DUF6705 family protein [Siphonobacter sp. SORGH_AS_1065]|uniref:DUF6705 family protein n=1 Tax=Siphonobacter sp. SORGH_AS_1065 TaxID=3041795 RepID=UPI002787EE8B|nr:DUF6705 family protein [Siphonobacter sp. SORGH_AS_1065]MDQ1090425.1 hypothetical protein [Siphonobacter sp. SORGH_AS_1065]
MKKIILLSILFAFIFKFNNSFSQSSLRLNSTYKSDNANKHVGEWKWSNGSETFKIYLFKDIMTQPGNIKVEVLNGYHSFEKDGKVIDSSYEFIKSSPKEQKSTLTLSLPEKDKTGNVLTGIIYFGYIERSYAITLQLDAHTHTFRAELEPMDGMSASTGSSTRRLVTPIKVPSNFELKKTK